MKMVEQRTTHDVNDQLQFISVVNSRGELVEVQIVRRRMDRENDTLTIPTYMFKHIVEAGKELLASFKGIL